jgi:hypothetical protein
MMMMMSSFTTTPKHRRQVDRRVGVPVQWKKANDAGGPAEQSGR